GEALKLDPRRSSVLLKLGLVALERGDPKKAEERVRQALTITPRAPVAHRSLALALSRQGRYGEAIQAAGEASTLAGRNDPEAGRLRGRLYYDTGRPADSERALQDALAARPDFQQAQTLLGLVKLDLAKTDEASALFEKVASRDPQSVWARLGRAVVQRN